jgi:hypothetical protein
MKRGLKYVLFQYDLELEHKAQWKEEMSKMSLNAAFKDAEQEEKLILSVAEETYKKDFLE